MKKQINAAIAIYITAVLLFSVDAFGFSKKKPADPPPAPTPVVTPTPAPSVTPSPTPAPPQAGKGSLEDIKKIAIGSKCAAYSFKNRGKAPAGYMKGMALSFTKSLCSPVKTISAKPIPGKTGDALNQYAKIFKDLGMENEGGIDTHRHVWTLLIGLGMRESTGKYCSGRDMSPAAMAKFTKSEEMEAGPFQTSYNIISYKKESRDLYFYYKNNPDKCLLDVWKEGVPPANDPKYCERNAVNIGTGEGLAYQKLAKQCPTLGPEAAGITIRFSGGPAGHYGPLRDRAAEVRPECDDMLKEVQDYVTTHLDVCKLF